MNRQDAEPDKSQEREGNEYANELAGKKKEVFEDLPIKSFVGACHGVCGLMVV